MNSQAKWTNEMELRTADMRRRQREETLRRFKAASSTSAKGTAINLDSYIENIVGPLTSPSQPPRSKVVEHVEACVVTLSPNQREVVVSAAAPPQLAISSPPTRQILDLQSMMVRAASDLTTEGGKQRQFERQSLQHMPRQAHHQATEYRQSEKAVSWSNVQLDGLFIANRSDVAATSQITKTNSRPPMPPQPVVYLPTWLLEPSRLPLVYQQVAQAASLNFAADALDTMHLQRIFLLSGLLQETLASVWAACCRTYPDRLTPMELFVALALIALIQQNLLPASPTLPYLVQTNPLIALTHLTEAPVPNLAPVANLATVPNVVSAAKLAPVPNLAPVSNLVPAASLTPMHNFDLVPNLVPVPHVVSAAKLAPVPNLAPVSNLVTAASLATMHKFGPVDNFSPISNMVPDQISLNLNGAGGAHDSTSFATRDDKKFSPKPASSMVPSSLTSQNLAISNDVLDDDFEEFKSASPNLSSTNANAVLSSSHQSEKHEITLRADDVSGGFVSSGTLASKLASPISWAHLDVTKGNSSSSSSQRVDLLLTEDKYDALRCLESINEFNELHQPVGMENFVADFGAAFSSDTSDTTATVASAETADTVMQINTDDDWAEFSAAALPNEPPNGASVLKIAGASKLILDFTKSNLSNHLSDVTLTPVGSEQLDLLGSAAAVSFNCSDHLSAIGSVGVVSSNSSNSIRSDDWPMDDGFSSPASYEPASTSSSNGSTFDLNSNPKQSFAIRPHVFGTCWAEEPPPLPDEESWDSPMDDVVNTKAGHFVPSSIHQGGAAPSEVLFGDLPGNSGVLLLQPVAFSQLDKGVTSSIKEDESRYASQMQLESSCGVAGTELADSSLATTLEHETPQISQEKVTQIDDRYRELAHLRGDATSQEEAVQRALTRCLQICVQRLEEANNVLAEIAGPDVCVELATSTPGRDYITCLCALRQLTCRLRAALRCYGSHPPLVEVARAETQLRLAWTNLTGFFSVCTQQITAQLSAAECEVSLEKNMNAAVVVDAVCGVCLCKLHPELDDCTMLQYGDAYYHATCANFWVNEVDPTLPRLKPPSPNYLYN